MLGRAKQPMASRSATTSKLKDLLSGKKSLYGASSPSSAIVGITTDKRPRHLESIRTYSRLSADWHRRFGFASAGIKCSSSESWICCDCTIRSSRRLARERNCCRRPWVQVLRSRQPKGDLVCWPQLLTLHNRQSESASYRSRIII